MRQIWPNRTQWMVITCMLLLLINNGFIVIGITAFDPVLLKELSLSVTALKSRDLIMLWSSGLMAPFIGYLADRFGVRPLFAIGTALLCAGMLAYAHVTSVWGLYAISVALGFSQACSGIVMAVIAISRWTGPHRGLAIGFAISGTSLGNAFVPQLNAWLITTLGWREAFMVLSAIPLFLFPLIFMVLREYVPGTKAISVPLKLAGFGVVIRSRNFILLSLAAAVSVFAVLGVTTNVILYAKSLALPASETGNLLWGFFGMSLLAQLAGGHFGDRLGAQRILLLGLALLAAGALALANPAHMPLIVGMLVMGMGWGSAVASLEHFASVLFAGPLFGRILGTLLMVETFVGGLGPVFVGNVYDRTGHFMTGFACISALCLIAVFMIACIRRDPVTLPDEIPLAAPVS